MCWEFLDHEAMARQFGGIGQICRQRLKLNTKGVEMDITKIRHKYNYVGGDAGWSDIENRRDYFRICGGVAWPQKGRPGIVALIAEQARNLKSGGPPKFYVLVESTHQIEDDMLSKCAELSLIVDAWYSNVTSRSHYFLLHEFNQRQEAKRLSAIQLLNVPMLSETGDAEQLFHYADSEFHRLTLNQKNVFLAECPKVRAALQNVPPVWAVEDILRLPEVTALYYALGAMLRLPYSIPSPAAGQAKIDYDIFNPPFEKKDED